MVSKLLPAVYPWPFLTAKTLPNAAETGTPKKDLFEVPSATDYGHENITGVFRPNLFIDISSTWDDKEEALKAYGTEMREYPHSRSIEAVKNLGKLRGNQVGLSIAEAFQVIRKIIHWNENTYC